MTSKTDFPDPADFDPSLYFHGQDVPPQSPEIALFHVIPAPLELSVSYGTGTSYGPAEILRASGQLELFDGKSIPADYGIFTAESVNCRGRVEHALENIRAVVRQSLCSRSIPVVLGGEHTVTLGAIEAIAEQHDSFGVIQFDAHADLRESYEGSKLSHACVMKRIWDKDIPILQIGTRSYSHAEQVFRKEQGIPYFDAEDICLKGLDVVQIPQDFPEKIYLTFDIDALDSAVFPATGTPVPGGLSWYQALWLIERCLSSRICLGFDVVEFAPVDFLHSCSFAAAQLVYNTMGYLTRSQINRDYWQLDKYLNP
jgi:agmatinase